jgi:hypothetical protein
VVSTMTVSITTPILGTLAVFPELPMFKINTSISITIYISISINISPISINPIPTRIPSMSNISSSNMSNPSIMTLMLGTLPPLFCIPSLLLAMTREHWLRLDQSTRFPNTMVEEGRPRSTNKSRLRPGPQLKSIAGMLKDNLLHPTRSPKR